MKKKILYIFGLLLLLYASLTGQYLEVEEFYDYAPLLAFVNLSIISFIMMIVPFIYFLINSKKINEEKGKKICKWNSIIIFIISIILMIINDGNTVLGIGGLGAIMYYFINKWLFVETGKKIKVKKDIELEELEKEIERYEIPSKTIYCKKCGGKLNKDKKCTKCGKQYFNIKTKAFLIIIPLLILLVISIILNIKFYTEKEALLEVSTTFYEENESLNRQYDELLNLYNYVEDKADFLDENIVFVLEGYGNYYYTYDCVQEITDGEYTYWAFNVEAARSRGYKKGTCN